MKQVKELDQRPAKVAAAKSDSKDKIKSEPKVEFASKPVTTKDEEAEPVQLKEEIVGEVDVEDVEPVDNEPLKAEEPQDEEVHFEDEEVHQEDLRYEVQLEDDAQREEPEVVKLEDEESRKTPDAEEDNTVNNNEPSPLKEERKWPPTLSKQKSVVKSGEPDEDDWAKKNISRSKVNALIARFQSGAAFNNNQQQTCSSTYKSEYGVSGKIGQIQQSRFN
ncbi:hypothetical protein L596_015454 [Steinernema carpocapsae]|uniref:Uncharacterized protein n=1 Tax=Steinernema carpocapsae TaxID=34508 RepID=A0A4U5NGB2_STECR|nr:hypothetical protein L596_015454 [Steinernema carpocapsae]